MKLINYFHEVKTELKNVTWPNKENVVKLTITILIFSAIVGLYVGLLDLGLTKLLEMLISSK
ncbi:MAG: preprotein translocase subunit SecE [Patescibacteria group bacterium]|nr:preprotein translocase subunit SecE [Patescibacteria group bacterium]